MITKSVAFITEQLPPGWGWDPSAPVRGTDKFYVKTAEAYANDFGLKRVVVYYDGPSLKTPINGVSYLNRSEIGIKPEFDRIIVCNPMKSTSFDRKLVKNMTLWTNFAMPKAQFQAWSEHIELNEYDEALCISQYAKSIMPIDVSPFFRVVSHGVDHNFYKPRSKRRKIAYTSSPDAGLDVIKAVLQHHPDWTLFHTPYGGVSKLSDAELAKELGECAYWVHPGKRVELFCLAAAEAQAAGCVPIVVPNGALANTVRFGFKVPPQDFEKSLHFLLKNHISLDVNANHIPSWADTVRYIEHNITDCPL